MTEVQKKEDYVEGGRHERGEVGSQHGNVEVTGFCLSACDFPPIAAPQISTSKQIHAQKS